MNTLRIKWFLFGIALALQFTQLNAAQRKEDPNSRPITVQVDAQRKEDPNTRPTGVIDTVRGWLSQAWTVLTDAQRKE
jgi:hypothetical protein